MTDPVKPPGTEDEENTGDALGDKSQNDGDSLDSLKLTPEQQAQFDNVLTKRLERERDKWQKEVDLAKEKAKKDADEARLAEQQQFQELANRRQSTIDDLTEENESLKVKAKEIDKYTKALAVYRDQMIAQHPESIQVLLKSMDIVDQLEWLAANQPEGTEGKPSYVGPPPAPNAKGDGKLTPEQKRAKAYKPRF